MAIYKLLGGKLVRRGRARATIVAGDEFVPSAAELAFLTPGIDVEFVREGNDLGHNTVGKLLKRTTPTVTSAKEVLAADPPAPAEEPEDDEAEVAEDQPYTDLGGGWYRLADGRKVQGKRALEEALKNG